MVVFQWAAQVHTYDICIATNVLHVSPSIDEALSNVKLLMNKPGLLVASEGVEDSLFSSLVYGFTQGCWLSRDVSNRLPRSPLVDADSWAKCMRRAGFINSYSLIKSMDLGFSVNHEIIMANV